MIGKQYITEGERIKKIRNNLGLTREDLAKGFGVGENFVGHIEQGRTIPTPHLLFLLCLQYNVNVNWIITGEGEMFRDNAILNSEFTSQTNNDNLDRIQILEEQVKLLKQLVLLGS